MLTPADWARVRSTEIEAPGSKIFFLKSRMMAGQADLSVNTQGLKVDTSGLGEGTFSSLRGK
jgi:hypothetical protein